MAGSPERRPAPSPDGPVPPLWKVPPSGRDEETAARAPVPAEEPEAGRSETGEAAVIQAFNALPPIPEDQIEPLLAQASALWLKYGFTTARDILTGLSPDDFAIARRAAEQNLLPLDLILYANAQLDDEAILEHKDWLNSYVGRVKLGGVGWHSRHRAWPKWARRLAGRAGRVGKH